jgi:ribose-phosphate pyrophosphokinase
MIYKNRSGPGEIKEMNLIGDVTDKNCIIVDDMADTCGTLCKATDLVLNYGAASVEAYCTHAILSGAAIDTLNKSELRKLYLTDTVYNPRTQDTNKIFILSAAELFAEAISGIHSEKSLSYLFDM